MRMRTYQSIWLCVWGGVAAFGVCLGFLLWPAVTVVAVFAVAAATAAIIAVGVLRHQGARPITHQELTRSATTIALAGGSSAVATAALGSIAAPMVWPMLVLCLVSSPWVLRFLYEESDLLPQSATSHNDAAHDGAAEANAAAASALASAVRALSDPELCEAWSASFLALGPARSPVAHGHIVALRQAYLDEIERRNPAGLRQWLESGARAASNPQKYLSHHPPHSDPDLNAA